MKSRVVVTVSVLILLGALSPRAWADQVQLTNGRTVEGLIAAESNVEVSLALPGGAIVRFPRYQVQSVSRSDGPSLVRSADAATDPDWALALYRRAKELNPDAAGLDGKIALVEKRVAELEAIRAQLEEPHDDSPEEGQVLVLGERNERNGDLRSADDSTSCPSDDAVAVNADRGRGTSRIVPVYPYARRSTSRQRPIRVAIRIMRPTVGRGKG